MPLDQLVQAGHVGFDIDFKVQQLVAVAIKDERVCLTIGNAAEDEPFGGLDNRIRNGGIGDDQV